MLQNCKAVLLLACCLLWIASSRAAAVDPATHTVRLALSTEPPNLNSLTTTDNVSFFVLVHTMEGLLSYGEHDTLVPGVAERWNMDGTQVDFFLRNNARWSDGQPVTAHDFVFAWQTAIAPGTASPYAFILFPLKNAEKIQRGELPPSALGVTAVDDRHLHVELEQPTAYFPSLTTFPTYLPLRADFYVAQQGRYGADAGNLLANGPFVVETWTHGASLSLKKNSRYWQSNRVSLERIDIPHITNDPNTLFNLFQANDIALAELTYDTVRQALQQRLYIQPFANGMLSYLEFNVAGHPTLGNVHLRRAIAASIDRGELVDKVIAAPGTRVASGFIPSWLLPDTPAAFPAHDPALARRELALALQQLGLSTPPTLRLLVYDSPNVVRQAEYLQRRLQQTLGLTLVIDRQIFKQKLAKLKNGDFDLSISAWGPDYRDPMTFADLLHSANENNHGRYHSEHYDAGVTAAGLLPDSPQRNAIFHELQQQLAEDVPVLPLAEPGVLYVQHPQLDGVLRHRFGGDPDFRFARIRPAETAR